MILWLPFLALLGCAVYSLIYSWKEASKRFGYLGESVYFFCFAFCCIVFVAKGLTWIISSESILSYYISIGVLFVIYLAFCIYSKWMLKRISLNHMGSILSKKIYKILLKLFVVIVSILFVFWIIVLLGMFIHDNNITDLENIYDMLSDREGILAFPEIIVGETKAILSFFEVGIYWLFASSDDEMWTVFLQSVRWSYGSIIIVTVLNTLLSFLGINDTNYENG